jgi:hypothetical protein
MKKYFNIIVVLLYLNTLGINAQNNCECTMCRVPCNAPLSAHKNPQCPAYIAAHKSDSPSAPSTSGSSNRNMNALNSLLKIASSSQTESTNTEVMKPAEPTYDPMEEAIKSTKNSVEKISDPETVDLSDLKNPYSAKVDAGSLKKIEKTEDAQEACKRAFEYKKSRTTALTNLIANSGNLVEQQQKSVVNAQSEIDKWYDSRSKVIADQIKGLLEEKLSDALPANNDAAWKAGNRIADATQIKSEESDLINFCNQAVAGLNTASNYVDLNPALKKAIEASPAKWAKMAVDHGPKLVDALSMVYIKSELNNQNKTLLKEKQNAEALNSRIESWKAEKKELDDCSDDDCNCIRVIILKRRPDLR